MDLISSEIFKPYQIVAFDYGTHEKNKSPIDSMWFYTKEEQDKPIKIQLNEVTQMLPAVFCETYIRVYCKKLHQPTIKLVKRY